MPTQLIKTEVCSCKNIKGSLLCSLLCVFKNTLEKGIPYGIKCIPWCIYWANSHDRIFIYLQYEEIKFSLKTFLKYYLQLGFFWTFLNRVCMGNPKNAFHLLFNAHTSLCRQVWGQELNWLYYPWVGTCSLCSEVLWISAKLCSTS